MTDENTKSSVSKGVARNFSVMFAAQIVGWIAGFVLLYFLPRYLGSEDFGRLYLALSVKMILGLFIDFGGNYLIPKEVSRSVKIGSKIMSSYILLRIGLWVLSIGLILLFSDILGYSDHVNLLILILAIAKLWEGSTTAFSAFFQGIEKMEYPSIGTITERVFVASVSVIALLYGADSTVMAIIITIGALLNLIVVFWFSRKYVKVSYTFDKQIFGLLHSGMPYFLFSLFSVIYYRIDALMLASITNTEVTGWYGGAYRFFDIVMVLPLLYRTAVFPVFAKLWKDTKGILEYTLQGSIRLMIILGIPTAAVIFMFSGDIVHFFMGLEEYTPSIIILQIFALSIPVIYIDIILGSAIMGAANKQNAWAVVGLVAIFVNISANLVLIPYTQDLYMNGGIGAAFATLITELFVMICAIWILPKSYFKGLRFSYFAKPVIATALMIIPTYFLIQTGLYWMINLLIAGIVYLIAIFVIRTFQPDETRLIRDQMTKGLNKISPYFKK
ncbi:MAG: flippase [Balneolia bacterium]|nr:flippase [Balneolia bacterium]